MTPIERMLAHLRSHGCDPKQNGHGWMAKCPAHDDKNPSLSVSVGDDGRALVKCFSGCPAEKVIEALELRMSDLMPENGTMRPPPSPARRPPGSSTKVVKTYPTAEAGIEAAGRAIGGQPVANWVYQNTDGTEVFRVVRYALSDGGKNYRPVHHAKDGWRVGDPPGKLVLYGLPALLARPHERVYVCEGEKAVDAARSVGLLTTTSAHGAKSAAKADWTPLAGRDVVIMPDHDPAGEQYAADVAAILVKLNPPATVRIVELPDLPEGGDFVEYLIARPDVAPDAIREEVNALANAAEQAEPEATAPPMEQFKPFPLKALPDPVRGFVQAVANSTGTDPAFAGLAALVVLAGCIGNRAAVLMRTGYTEPSVLWGALIGMSGTVKTPVLKLVTRGLYELYKNERAVFVEDTQKHHIEVERYAVRLAAWKQEQKKGPPTDPPLPPEPPREKRLLVSDITVEKLGCLLQDNPLGLLLVRDELAAWIGSFDRYAAGGKGSDGPAWLSMNDASTVTIDRKSASGTIFCERAAVSILGTIQPGTLRRVFGAAEREAGLLARVLLAFPPRQAALWTDEGLPDDTAADWKTLLAGLLALEPAMEDDGTARPRYLPLSGDAKALWVQWHDRHARETLDVDSEDLVAHFAKLKGVCVRFALTFACVQAVASEIGCTNIDRDTLERAITLTEWFKYEARRIYSLLSEGEERRAQRHLVELIRRKGGEATIRDWQRARSHPTSVDAEAELEGLVAAGLGQWEVPAPGPSGGRPTKRFKLSDTTDTDKTALIGSSSGVSSVSELSEDATTRSDADDRERGEI